MTSRIVIDLGLHLWSLIDRVVVVHKDLILPRVPIRKYHKARPDLENQDQEVFSPIEADLKDLIVPVQFLREVIAQVHMYPEVKHLDLLLFSQINLDLPTPIDLDRLIPIDLDQLIPINQDHHTQIDQVLFIQIGLDQFVQIDQDRYTLTGLGQQHL